MIDRKRRSEYLYPLRLIREKRLTKSDVRKVKDNISMNMTIVRLVSAILLYLVSFVMMIMMGVSTSWNQIEVYGLTSIIAQIISMFGCLITIILLIASYASRKERTSVVLNRVASYFLFVGIALQMMFGIYADAEMGFTTQQSALSASIIFLAVLLVIQPSYWFDAIFLDVATFISMIGLCTYCTLQFGMKVLYYYIVILLAFPLCCYFIVTILFYAEYQHYKELLENERLTNKAYYDDLTLCKNRHSLKKYIEENALRWEEEDNPHLLIIMFDIDNFKDYNDQFSHLSGDDCLKEIADAIRGAFPSPDLHFYRYGGEEFLMFFEVDNQKEAIEILNKLRNSVKELNIVAPVGAPRSIVTISLGATHITELKHFRFDEQIEKVDKYLYKAKENGKDISCLDDKLIK